MKKFTVIICTLAMLASLTACSSGDLPSGETTDDKQIVVSSPSDSADKAPESAPEEVSSDSVTDEKNTANDADTASGSGGNSTPAESDPTESADKDNAESKPEDNTESKTEDASESKTENSTEQTNAPGTEKTLPLKQYPDGSYFTYDGKPCTDHDSCNWDVECNCVNFDRSIQSMGFAKYVYYQVTGKHVSAENRTEINADVNAETAETTLVDLPLGTYIAVTQGNGVPHFMIAVDAGESGITVYQANYGGGCVVRLTSFSWADFAAKFPHIDYVELP